MYLESLRLTNFRNYRKRLLMFSKNTSLIIGNNAVGKTNIIEAIYLLATGLSFRATKSEEMILYGQELARVAGGIYPLKFLKEIKSKAYLPLTTVNSEDELEIVLTTGEVQGQRTVKKKYLVNGAAKRRMDFVGRLRAVLFRPEDIGLVLGGPSIRREYLDQVLEQVDWEYRRSSLSYQKGLRQRNKLLLKIREREAQTKQLLFWNNLLIKNGQRLNRKREAFLDYVNKELKDKQSSLKLEYKKNFISEGRLEKYAEKEIWAGKTLVGPHRDEFRFIIQRKGKIKKDLSIYGSRGEQRMAVFELKLAELEFMGGGVCSLNKNKQAGEGDSEEDRPILLLDDVFSELDREHRSKVFSLLERQQTVITSSDEGLIPKVYLKRVEIVRL